MSKTSFFDEEELKKLPPAKRAELIKKRLAEIEKEAEEEAKKLEDDSQKELALLQDQKALEELLRREAELRIQEENRNKNSSEINLEQSIKNSPSIPQNPQVSYGTSPKIETLEYEHSLQTIGLGDDIGKNQFADTRFSEGSLYKDKKDLDSDYKL